MAGFSNEIPARRAPPISLWSLPGRYRPRTAFGNSMPPLHEGAQFIKAFRATTTKPGKPRSFGLLIAVGGDYFMHNRKLAAVVFACLLISLTALADTLTF